MSKEALAANYLELGTDGPGHDINADGFDDIVVSAKAADNNGTDSGSTYVIYGHKAMEDVVRVGTTVANKINGGLGDDQASGLGGGDTLIGWEGSDTLNGGSGHDSISAGSEDDQVAAGSGNDTVDGGTGDDIIIGDAGNDNLNGGTDDDILRGGGGNDSLNGGTGVGDDLMVGAGGNDTFFASAGDDTAQGGSGSDFLRLDLFPAHGVSINLAVAVNDLDSDDSITIASIEQVLGTTFNDTILGNARANSLQGNSGNDTLSGGGGNDVLVGAAGTDSMTGGSGQDIFDFTGPLAANIDTITDFTAVDDTIRLRAAIFTALTAGPLPAGAFNTGTAATQADDRIIYNTTTHALLYDPDGLNGTAATQFAIVNGTAPTAAGFVVI